MEFFIIFADMRTDTPDEFEYVAFVARRFCRPEDIGNPALENDAEYVAISHFKSRYATLFKNQISQCRKYLSSDDIHDTLKKYKLDYKKFWRLYLFILDYTNLSFSCIHKLESMSVRELAKTLFEEIKKSKQIKIEVNSTTYSTIHPLFIALLSNSLQNIAASESDMVDSMVCISSTSDLHRYRVGRMKFFVEMMSYFLKAKVNVRRPSKMSFIGPFLYLAELSYDHKFWYRCNPTQPEECLKYELVQNARIIVDGKELVALPYDVGKNIADTIKKCNDKPNVQNTFYYFNVTPD